MRLVFSNIFNYFSVSDPVVSSNLNLTLSPSHTNYITALAFSSDHSYLSSCDYNNTVYNKINFWSASSNWTFTFQLSNGALCYTMTQLPNGQLASGSNNKINIWDPLNNVAAPLRTLTGHSYTVYALALSPDGIYLASGSSDNSVKLWFYASQTTAFKTLTGHTNRVTALCFVSNQILASGSFDLSIKIWNITSGI